MGWLQWQVIQDLQSEKKMNWVKAKVQEQVITGVNSEGHGFERMKGNNWDS